VVAHPRLCAVGGNSGSRDQGRDEPLLPDSSPRSILIASALGAASSSCSYAAVALARSLFRRGADFIAAMAFQFASTNLVIELGMMPA